MSLTDHPSPIQTILSALEFHQNPPNTNDVFGSRAKEHTLPSPPVGNFTLPRRNPEIKHIKLCVHYKLFHKSSQFTYIFGQWFIHKEIEGVYSIRIASNIFYQLAV